MNRRTFLVCITLSMFLPAGFFLPTLNAQTDYPTRPVEITCPYAAGGSLDMHMRAIVAVGESYLGQPLIPAIRSGAAGTIGTAYVARSRPDGYTLLLGAIAPMTVKPIVEKLPYKPEDFIPIGRISATPPVFSVLSTSPWKSLKEFIEDAKKNPGKYKYGSAGYYEPEHLTMEAIMKWAGIKLIHVPLGGGGPSMAALLGGHTDIGGNMPASILTHVAAGTLRPLAVAGDERLNAKELKDVPTLKELGCDHENYLWIAQFAPKGTPQPIVQKLRKVLKQICEDKSFERLMTRMGEEIKYMSGEDFEVWWKNERATMGSIIDSILKK